MPKPTPKQKMAVGIYVTALSLVILLIWGFFLKQEFKSSASSAKQKPDDTFSQMLSNFKQMINSSRESLGQIKEAGEQISVPTSTAETVEIPEDLKASIVEKALEKIREESAANQAPTSTEEFQE